jgi:RNA polymerase sigma-70 factor, ECF subfamily
LDDHSPQELVRRAQKRDDAAFAQLVRLFERTALAIAYSVVGDASTAGDVTQEAFIRAWQRLRELDDPDRFGAWLARIVRNLATDQARRRPGETIGMPANDPAVVSATNEIDRTETQEGISAALAELDELTRSAVVLRYYQGLASKEIAELLELSPSAVDMRLSRARAQLRQKLAWLDPGAADSTDSRDPANDDAT